MQKNLAILSRAINEWMPEGRAVSQNPSAEELKKQLDLSLSDEGSEIEALEPYLRDYLHFNPDASQVDFFKLLYSGMNEAAVLGDWITSISNANMHTYQVSPVATLMELELIKQCNNLVGFEDGNGIMVPGGSQANLMGMMLARQHACPDFKEVGFAGRTLVAYVSDQAHYSAKKAANVLGIGSDNLIAVESDADGRISPDALKIEIEKSLVLGHIPFFIGLTAGTTVIGAYDPIAACHEIAQEHNIWLHIDGAWGAPIIFSNKYRHLIADCHLADSFAWDAHKLMNVPLTAAFILTKKKGVLTNTCSGGGASYLFHADENYDYNLGNKSIQCGRRADSLKVWSSWKVTGNKGYAEKVDYLQSIKQHCVDAIKSSDVFEMLAPAVYLNILFRYKVKKFISEEHSSALNTKITKTLIAEGGSYIDYASFKGKLGIRLILANENVTKKHIDTLLEDIERVGQRLESEGSYYCFKEITHFLQPRHIADSAGVL